MSGWHQLCLAGLAIAATLLNLAPIELQRRLVDDAIAAGDGNLLILLGITYAGVVLAHQIVKFALGYYQAWVGERITAYTRNHLLRLHLRHEADESGSVVQMLGGETEKLGGFVGGGPSAAVANLSMLFGVLIYMAWVEPKIAAVSAALIAPQLIFTPFMQRRLNRLLQRRVRLMRRFGSEISNGEEEKTVGRRIIAILANRLRFNRWKLLLKAGLNLLNAAAPLSVLLWGGWLAIQGETTVGVLLAFVSGFERLSKPIRELSTFYREAAQAAVQHEMIARWMCDALERPRR